MREIGHYFFKNDVEWRNWPNHAKRDETRQKRIKEIITFCAANMKQRTI